MNSEFDAADLAALVSEALGTSDPLAEGDTTPAADAAGVFALGEPRLLEALDRVLADHDVDRAAATSILDDLRRELLDGQSRTDLRVLHRLSKDCRACPQMTPDPQIPLWNKVDPDVAFLGEGPWTGTDGDAHLVGTLREAGFDSRRVGYTYLTRCTPQGPRRRPEDDEISRCTSRWLFTELTAWTPKVIVPLGAVPTRVLVGEGKMAERRGVWHWLGPWTVLPTYAPAYAARDATSAAARDFAADLAAVHNYTYGR